VEDCAATLPKKITGLNPDSFSAGNAGVQGRSSTEAATWINSRAEINNSFKKFFKSAFRSVAQMAFSTALSAACGNFMGTKYSSGYK
jgi:hypothetical protein